MKTKIKISNNDPTKPPLMRITSNDDLDPQKIIEESKTDPHEELKNKIRMLKRGGFKK